MVHHASHTLTRSESAWPTTGQKNRRCQCGASTAGIALRPRLALAGQPRRRSLHVHCWTQSFVKSSGRCCTVRFQTARLSMACNPEVLKHVPLFALLDEEETAVLAGQVELRNFAPRQRIYKIGDPGEQAYVMVSGKVRVTTVDQDNQDVVVDEPSHGEFFGFASMLEETPHQTGAMAVEDTVCVEVTRDDIAALLQRKPMAGMDMLTVLGRQFHSAQQLVR